MNEKATTLRDLLMPSDGDFSRQVLAELEGTQRMRELKERLAQNMKAANWPGSFGLLVGKIGELLSVAIIDDIFVKVWNEAKLFRRYLDRSRYPAGETIEVPMAEHTIKSTHRPHIDLRLNDTLIDRIHFEISVDITVEGIVLEIRDAKIMKIRTGQCKGKAELTCQGLLLASEKFDSINLPGEKEFEGGIAIAAGARRFD